MNPKYIRLQSDLHLDGFRGTPIIQLVYRFLPPDDRDASSVLVLAGDISSDVDQVSGLIHAIEGRFQHVVYIPGNHEPYHQDLNIWASRLDSLLKSLTFNTSYALLDTGVKIIGDVRFVFCTLWGDGGATFQDQSRVAFYLNDFRCIKVGDRKFRVSDMVELHKRQRADIERILQQPFDGKTVVATHHLPSRLLVSERFKERDGTDGANGGFCSNCEAIMVSDYAPNLWAFGHTHDRISGKLYRSAVECNPTGYRKEYGNGFSGGDPLFIELSELT